MEKNKSMTIVLCSKDIQVATENKIIKNIDKIKLQRNDYIFMPAQSIIITNFFLMGASFKFYFTWKRFFSNKKKNYQIN